MNDIMSYHDYIAASSTSELTNAIGTILGGILGLASTTLIVCLIAYPFVKKLIKYAIEEYFKHK